MVYLGNFPEQAWGAGGWRRWEDIIWLVFRFALFIRYVRQNISICAFHLAFVAETLYLRFSFDMCGGRSVFPLFIRHVRQKLAFAGSDLCGGSDRGLPPRLGGPPPRLEVQASPATGPATPGREQRPPRAARSSHWPFRSAYRHSCLCFSFGMCGENS